jgi:alpha-galactosidase
MGYKTLNPNEGGLDEHVEMTEKVERVEIQKTESPLLPTFIGNHAVISAFPHAARRTFTYASRDQTTSSRVLPMSPEGVAGFGHK